MRLRNKPWVKEYLITANNNYLVSNPENMIGKWHELFHNYNPIHIEIGSGKGNFILQMAKLYPDINFIAIEKFRTVVGIALKKLEAEPKKINNLYWLDYNAEHLDKIFDDNKINRIYLNFSDPWPKKRHTKRRLTAPNFIELYNKILSPDGTVQLKTDNVDLFNFSLESFSNSKWNILLSSYDLYNDEYLVKLNVAITEYEEKFHNQGKKICFGSFVKQSRVYD